MQWDIAAGDAVVRAAGGAVVLASTGEDFVYRVPENARKDDLRNPSLLSFGDRSVDWVEFMAPELVEAT